MEIREACEAIASIQEKAVLKSFGIDVESDSDIEDDESETDSEGEDMLCAVDSETTGGDMKSGPIPLPQTPGNAHLVGQNDSTGTVQKPCSTDQQENAVLISGNPEYVMDLLRSCRLNWFEFVGRVRQIMENQTEDCIKQFLINFSEQIKEAKLSEHEKYLIEQSKQAFYLNEDLEKELSDEELIQSECEEGHVDWGTIHDPLQAEAKDIISKRVKSIRLKAKRNAAKKIAEARFLRRKRRKTVGRILKECPDIGKTIESYVKRLEWVLTAGEGLAF